MCRQRKLTADQEHRIRRLIALRRRLTNVELAKRFGVSETLISDIGRCVEHRMEKKIRRAITSS